MIRGRRPPMEPRGDERVEYLPEYAYTDATPGFPHQQAARVTARTVAQWATHFEAWPVGDLDWARAGILPGQRDARVAFIDRQFDWIEAWQLERYGPVGLRSMGIRLFHDQYELLDQHDGVPLNRLWLTAREHQLLQAELASAGIPIDFYFPAETLHCFVEPVQQFGGVVLMEQCYSPVQWRHRQAAVAQPLSLPSEEERRTTLMLACADFARALSLRQLEFMEPGKSPDEEEVAIVRAVNVQLHALIKKLQVG